MTKFSITMLAGIALAIIAATLDDRADDFVRYALIILAAVMIGAIIAVEARHQHYVSLKKHGKSLEKLEDPHE